METFYLVYLLKFLRKWQFFIIKAIRFVLDFFLIFAAISNWFIIQVTFIKMSDMLLTDFWCFYSKQTNERSSC